MSDPSQIILARILNFVHPATPWYRSLWCASTDSSLSEVVEYAEVGRDTETRNDGLRYVANSLAQQIDRDPGIGSEEVRAAIKTLLTTFAGLPAKTYPAEADLELLRQWRARTADGYLARWKEALAAGGVEPESAARRITSALLDWGLDARQVAEIAVPRNGESELDTLRRLLDESHLTLVKGRSEYEVVLPLTAAATKLLAGRPLDDQELATTLQANGSASERANQAAGAVVITVQAFDPWSAALEAARQLRRLSVRASIAGDQQAPRRLGLAFVMGYPDPIVLEDGRRRVVVPNLTRGMQGSEADWPESFDNALEMAESMSDESPAVAVSAGWAAIEGLLARGSEASSGTVAADRVASIVACAWPRGELGTLGAQYYRNRREPTKYAGAMGSTIADLLRASDPPTFEMDRDTAGLIRMQQLFKDPAAVMARTESYLRDAFRRLYNQRNLVMHQATHRSALLDVTVRTATPLVAAALDRVAYGLRWGRSPLAQAERARIELSMLGTAGEKHLELLL